MYLILFQIKDELQYTWEETIAEKYTYTDKEHGDKPDGFTLGMDFMQVKVGIRSKYI